MIQNVCSVKLNLRAEHSRQRGKANKGWLLHCRLINTEGLKCISCFACHRNQLSWSRRTKNAACPAELRVNCEKCTSIHLWQGTLFKKYATHVQYSHYVQHKSIKQITKGSFCPHLALLLLPASSGPADDDYEAAVTVAAARRLRSHWRRGIIRGAEAGCSGWVRLPGWPAPAAAWRAGPVGRGTGGGRRRGCDRCRPSSRQRSGW